VKFFWGLAAGIASGALPVAIQSPHRHRSISWFAVLRRRWRFSFIAGPERMRKRGRRFFAWIPL
jgi:hypothetical protein